ncbi:MAG TPA: hypothetical protein VFD58_09095 [Blastocatellia bacterium]|nr:hypothetical protein [Blastocatellia bacterium]
MSLNQRWKLITGLCLVIWGWNAVIAQAQTPTDLQSRAADEARARAPWVTASVSAERLRFAAPAEVFQLRLEVFSVAGERVFDSDFRLGNLLDWAGQDQQGRRLLDGAYRCLVTVRDLAGRTSQREGRMLVQADAFSLPPADSAAAIQSASADRSLLTAVGEAAGSATTLLSHDGTDGRLTASRGALSLRTGNFFTGTDAERMRITAAGDVGIGVEQPGAKLDVAGLIRTSEGIVFPDGTIQKTAANPGTSAARDRLTALDNPTGSAIRDRLSPGRTVPAGSEQQGKAAQDARGPNQVNSIAGTANRIARFAADGATLVDSSVTESPTGDIGIGTATPGGVFDLQRNSAGDILQRLWNTGSGGAKLRYVAATGATSQLQLTDGQEWLMAIAGNNTAGMQFRVRNTTDPNSEAALAAAAKMTLLRNGNVGIGTTNPALLNGGSGRILSISDPFNPGIALTNTGTAGKQFFLYSAADGVQDNGSFRIYDTTNQAERMVIDYFGRVGIGTATPIYKLHVVDSGTAIRGDATGVGGTGVFGRGNGGPGVVAESVSGVALTVSTAGTNNLVEGYILPNINLRQFHITNAGTYVAGSDFAEALPARGEKAGYEPGDVLVLSTAASGTVEQASRPNDRRLAGVYSTRPGLLGADKNGTSRVDADDLPVAIVGIVPTKVSAENGPVRVGDLLTTSSTPGYAMKASPVRVGRVKIYRTGTILGKALEPLRQGKGVIKVLITLR